ncbi:Uncharacterized protein DBV15_03466 [Temnothorax longispinosus]|uniref:Uncharacterized protein n=1 Tax=Temnothorax longispinosus TaxID=300112 RepID=A0A4S2KE57_9HYME|nr:Uncharacterized protein DBV15_03466 [Temnothorax longispinosus]
MGLIIAVFSLVTDHRGLPHTIVRANNFARAITSYAVNSGINATTNGQLTLVNSHNHVFRKPPSRLGSLIPTQHLHLQIETRTAAIDMLSFTTIYFLNPISLVSSSYNETPAGGVLYVISHRARLGKVCRRCGDTFNPRRERQEPLR